MDCFEEDIKIIYLKDVCHATWRGCGCVIQSMGNIGNIADIAPENRLQGK